MHENIVEKNELKWSRDYRRLAPFTKVRWRKTELLALAIKVFQLVDEFSIGKALHDGLAARLQLEKEASSFQDFVFERR